MRGSSTWQPPLNRASLNGSFSKLPAGKDAHDSHAEVPSLKRCNGKRIPDSVSSSSGDDAEDVHEYPVMTPSLIRCDGMKSHLSEPEPGGEGRSKGVVGNVHVHVYCRDSCREGNCIAA